MSAKESATYDALALFSGGLDSLLSIKMIQEQGLRVLGLHFISPFFGNPHKTEHWEHAHGIELLSWDVSQEFLDMLTRGPKHGLGKLLNPCVDCKIFMLTKAKSLMPEYGAKFIISGEVLGQRPMSQRKDTLYIIRRETGLQDELLRVLSAKHLPPTRPEREGLVDREKLGDLSGRSRKEQLALARYYNIREVPTPAGGCLLTQEESCKRYLPLLKNSSTPRAKDFHLANVGRQLWAEPVSGQPRRAWLVIGRHKQDNELIQDMAEPEDYLFKLKSHPGPTALGRNLTGEPWPEEILHSAASLVAYYSPKARKSYREADVLLLHQGKSRELVVWPGSQEHILGWEEPEWNQDLAEELLETEA